MLHCARGSARNIVGGLRSRICTLRKIHLHCLKASVHACTENLLGEIVVNRGIIAKQLDVGISEQLGVSLSESLADELLDVRVVQLMLASRFSGDQFVNGIADRVLRPTSAEEEWKRYQ